MKNLYSILLFILLASGNIANAQFSKLIDFDNVNARNARGSLIYDNTHLYGLTSQGGANDKGTIFKVKPDGTGYTTLLDFSGTNGNEPTGTLLSDGTFLYGLTRSGGINSKGTIFKIKPDGTNFTKLFDFDETTNGCFPEGALISDGTFLYGMTSFGGTNGQGTIFKIKFDGTGFSTLYHFANLNGKNPYGSLLSDGTYLYGMTQEGGTSSLGIIFKIKPDGTNFTKLFDFSDGNSPHGTLISDGTFLYGMTSDGGNNSQGIIFKIKPDGTSYTKLFDFQTATTGRYPYGSLLHIGSYLYGMTSFGGINSDGAIFKIKTNGTSFTKLFDFNFSTTGSNPNGDLLFDGSNLYGMTSGGSINGDGLIFKMTGVVGTQEINDFPATTIYPDPSNGIINLSINNNKNIDYQLHVYNIMGENVYHTTISKEKSTINLSNLNKGVYFIYLSNSDHFFSKKIIIK